jgi:cytohesin
MRRLMAQDPGLANARQCPAAATPLHVAAEYGHDDVVRLLLEAGAAIDSRRIEGLTPLHLAASYGRFPVVKRLLAAGANPNSRESGGWTPLHRAASEGHENVVRLLLAQGADPRAMDHQGATPFEYAFLNRHRTVAELLAAGDAAFSTASSSRAALAKAARDGDAEGVRFLISKGVDVNAVVWNGLTPLHMPSIRDRRETLTGTTYARGKNGRWSSSC